MAIIGILAAVAIPAYNAYQNNAKIGVVESSLNQMLKAFNACLAVGNTVSQCGTATVNGTVRAQANTVLDGQTMSGAAPACLSVAYQTGGTTTQQGCFQLDATGNLVSPSMGSATFPTDAEIGNAAKGACTAAGLCENT